MMKKMAAILSVLMMVTILFSGIGDVFATEFSDVPITASYYKAVDRLSSMGIIQGRGDGLFLRRTEQRVQNSVHFLPVQMVMMRTHIW